MKKPEIKCPQCGSTDIRFARDMKLGWRCGACGNEWTPAQDEKDFEVSVFLTNGRSLICQMTQKMIDEIANGTIKHSITIPFPDGRTMIVVTDQISHISYREA